MKKPIKTSEKCICVGADYVKIVEAVAVDLTAKLKRPVSIQEAARIIIDGKIEKILE